MSADLWSELEVGDVCNMELVLNRVPIKSDRWYYSANGASRVSVSSSRAVSFEKLIHSVSDSESWFGFEVKEVGAYKLGFVVRSYTRLPALFIRTCTTTYSYAIAQNTENAVEIPVITSSPKELLRFDFCSLNVPLYATFSGIHLTRNANSHSRRVAVCVSGGVRTFPDPLLYRIGLLERVVEPFRKRGWDTDIFIVLNSTATPCVNSECVNLSMTPETMIEIEKTLGPVSVEWCDLKSATRESGNLTQLDLINRSFELAKCHAQKNGFCYDFYVRTRPDFLPSDKFDEFDLIEEIAIASQFTIGSICKSDSQQSASDMFFIVPGTAVKSDEWNQLCKSVVEYILANKYQSSWGLEFVLFRFVVARVFESFEGGLVRSVTPLIVDTWSKPEPQHRLVLNRIDLTNKRWQYSIGRTARIQVTAEEVKFEKLVDGTTSFAWLGFDVAEPGVYKLSFVCEGTLPPIPFIKSHNPTRYYTPQVEGQNYSTLVDIESPNTLVCLIFDEVKERMSLKFKNFQIVPNTQSD